MPTLRIKSAAEYREHAKKLRLAAETALFTEARDQLLMAANSYEDLAKHVELIEQYRAGD